MTPSNLLFEEALGAAITGRVRLREMLQLLGRQSKRWDVLAESVRKAAEVAGCPLRLSVEKEKKLIRWRLLGQAKSKTIWTAFDDPKVKEILDGCSVAVRKHVQRLNEEVRELNLRSQMITYLMKAIDSHLHKS